MLSNKSNKELVEAGHQFAKALDADMPLTEIAKLVSALATRLDCAIVRGDELQQKLDRVTAQNAKLKNGIGFFSYGTDSGFEEHDSAEKAIAAADSDIDYYRGDACDGWSEETDRTVWGVIMQRATMTGLRPVEEGDNCAEGITEYCDYTLLPNYEIATTLTALPVERDQYGYWSHPDYLAFCDGREYIPTDEFDQWMEAKGLEWKVNYRDEEETDYDADGYDLSTWNPEAPAGDGWFVGSIHDTDDGAVCIWLRAKAGV